MDIKPDFKGIYEFVIRNLGHRPKTPPGDLTLYATKRRDFGADHTRNGPNRPARGSGKCQSALTPNPGTLGRSPIWNPLSDSFTSSESSPTSNGLALRRSPRRTIRSFPRGAGG